jgi:hypothetical protein
MAEGMENIRGFEWIISGPELRSKDYIADCRALKAVAIGDTYEDLRLSIDDILDDLEAEFGTLEKYAELLKEEKWRAASPCNHRLEDFVEEETDAKKI